MVKVIASSLRKGNVVEHDDGKLYVVLTAENIHPGKGNSVTQVDMRRISDGVKVAGAGAPSRRSRGPTSTTAPTSSSTTTARATTSWSPTTYDQIAVREDVIGDQAAYLRDGMEVHLKTFEGVALAIELPQRVTLEIVETEPVVKGQTASSSYKPAILSNGVKTMVPPHIGVGTRVVVMTEDGSYVERAKD